MLSGYSTDPRGNGDMTSDCINWIGGAEKKVAPTGEVKAEVLDVAYDDERKRARAAWARGSK